MNEIRASKNIELKARYADLCRAKESLKDLELRDAGILEQIDTYFSVLHGRLKLREIVGVKSELISYERSNEARFRESKYQVVPITHPGELKIALTASLGLRGVVRKHRQVYLWQNVRIHLDEVENLGSFVEFEAVVAVPEDGPRGHDQLAQLCKLMSVSPGDYLRESYIDLLGEMPRATL